MRTVDIDPAAVLAAASVIPEGQPIVMINLLRYREQADYGGRTEFTPCSGREAYYQRYAPVSSRLVMADGARILWFGDVLGRVIAPPEERWDDALLVEYPSFGALQRLFANPEYQAAVLHRTAALEDSRLLPARTSSATVTPSGIG